ncbi:MAG: radical SAM peptide maturase [Bacteroidales bacterium]|nr:radical SAM peptide maturase [Bacteroidales bacterium]
MKLTPLHIKESICLVPQITFEVTQACNLNCAYCAYGRLYNSEIKRERKNLPVEYAIQIIKYLVSFWDSKQDPSFSKQVYISFYGGEPLLNIDFIKQVVAYVEGLNLTKRQFVFSMTTNATLLDKYIDYLVSKNFRLLISIDGNKENHSYRVTHNKNNSFDVVYRNVKAIQEQYPLFFRDNVNFNAVLHKKNSVSDIFNFINEEFDKNPTIGELTTVGIKPESKAEFWETYQNKKESILLANNTKTLKEKLFLETPEINQLALYLHQYSQNVYNDYNELLFDSSETERLPTGTCIPFGKRMFITAEGGILACEKIDQKYVLGNVDYSGVYLDFDEIAQIYNDMYSRLAKQCSTCSIKNACQQCIFTLENKDNPICRKYMDKTTFKRFEQYQMDLLRENPYLYEKIMKEVIIN